MATTTRAYHRHGMTKSKIWRLWYSMVQRCTNPKATHYDRYGGRGICVCPSWMTFANFYADMGDRPEGCSLDRINNSLGYEPANCRWATFKQQHANRDNNRMLTHNGQTKCIPEWSAMLGISQVTIHGRLRRGATPEAALQPVSATKRPALRISRCVG